MTAPRSRARAPESAAVAPAWPAISPVWMFLALLLAGLLVYWPALSGTMLWDDDGHVTRPDLQSPEGLWRIWFEFGATQQYYPVLHSAFWLEHRLWGDATLGYHLTNVVLHAGVAFLFGRLLARLAVPGAWLAAFLFAVHPVCVESVAWISEQKNTLSAVFYLGAALTYLRFETDRGRWWFLGAGGLFVLALLTKTVTATLPAALLVLVWWRNGRIEWRRDVVPLLPWFALAVAAGLITAHFERELIGARGEDFALTGIERTLLAGRVVWFYLGKLLWPVDLAFIYPRWKIDAASAVQWMFPIVTVFGLAGLVWWSRRQRGPLAAALLFGGTLFPVLGFFNVFPFLFSYVADHFQYLASLACFALATAGAVMATARWPRLLRGGVALMLLATLAVLSLRQARIYRDVFTLYEDTLAKNPDCWMAHNNLAIALAEKFRLQEAVAHYERALRLRPDFAPAENNLGDSLLQLERPQDALPHLERAVKLQPNYAVAHRNLGMALAMLGHTAEALPHFENAVRFKADYADAELQWAIGLMLTGRFDAAVPHFERAIQLQPAQAHFHHMYGRALAAAGRGAEAVLRLESAVRLDPGKAEMHLDLALALRRLGRVDEATKHYLEANRLNPALAPRR